MMLITAMVKSMIKPLEVSQTNTHWKLFHVSIKSFERFKEDLTMPYEAMAGLEFCIKQTDLRFSFNKPCVLGATLSTYA